MLRLRPDERVAKRTARSIVKRMQRQTRGLEHTTRNMARWLERDQLIETDSYIKPRLKALTAQLEEVNFLIDLVRFARKAQP